MCLIKTRLFKKEKRTCVNQAPEFPKRFSLVPSLVSNLKKAIC